VAFFRPGELALLISWTGDVMTDHPPVLILSMSMGKACVSGSLEVCNLYSVWWTDFLIDQVDPQWLEKMVTDDENS